MVVDSGDAFLQRGSSRHRSVHGEVAALGMAARHQRAPENEPTSHGGKILCGGLLRRYGGDERHVEVFLPAGERGIGAAERDKSLPAGQQERDGGELLHPLIVLLLGEKAQPYVSEARAHRGGCQQGIAVFGACGIFAAVYHRPLLGGQGGEQRAHQLGFVQAAQPRASPKELKAGTAPPKRT